MPMLPILLTVLACPAQDVAPTNPDARIDEGVRRALEAFDPALGGWQSEADSEQISARLGQLGQALWGKKGDFEGVVSEELECGPVYPGPEELLGIFAQGELRVRRGKPVEETGYTGPGGWGRLTGELRQVLGQTTRVELKLVGIQREGQRSETRVLMHLAGQAAEGLVELASEWQLSWEWGEAGPVLVAASFGELTEVRGQEPMLLERTSALFGSDGAFYETQGEEQLGFGWGEGLNGLRRNLDARLGLPILGSASGLAVGDVNGDGLEDLYLAQPGGLPNRLLLHTKDHGLVDASYVSGADFLNFSRAALLLDFDGDGDRDLAVSLDTSIVFLENDGTGRFEERFVQGSTDGSSMAASDFDGDGDLDVYVCAYVSPYRGSVQPIPYHDAQNGLPNLFLVNDGEWGFEDQAEELGLGHNNNRFSLAAAWADYDGDGDQDLYVANDFGRNNLYRNDDGRFSDVAASAGVEDLSAGMGVSWGDYDGDGLLDLYVSNMYSAAGQRVVYQRQFHADADAAMRSGLQRHANGNSLFRNLGDGRFADVSEQAGVHRARWAWGACFIDLNNDGALDILSPNGFLTGPKPDDL